MKWEGKNVTKTFQVYTLSQKEGVVKAWPLLVFDPSPTNAQALLQPSTVAKLIFPDT
jgi:hypothetical protein